MGSIPVFILLKIWLDEKSFYVRLDVRLLGSNAGSDELGLMPVRTNWVQFQSVCETILFYLFDEKNILLQSLFFRAKRKVLVNLE